MPVRRMWANVSNTIVPFTKYKLLIKLAGIYIAYSNIILSNDPY